ncbi:MAG: 16S rRNA (guanine(966)-N(2))-methyltransferase RsmD [Spirochaetota bacterium]|nr:16S rRNA (guanine(966)-N(2))-methyltransferase RsmD [Exilispira sp.]
MKDGIRIIGGRFKGRKISVPPTDLRPTISMVKEAVFDIIDDKIKGAIVLDLFAGSGNYGIEAFSRGAKQVDFVDRNGKSCKTIKENLKELGLKANVFSLDFRNFLKRWNCSYDFIFASPPYFLGFEDEILNCIFKYQRLKEDGILFLQIFKKIDPDLSNFIILDERRYGITKLYILKNKVNKEDS